MSMAERIKYGLNQNKVVILSFFLPFFLMIFGFIRADFFPFGDNQVAVIDLYHQYFPFLSELQDKLQNGGSLLHTWNGGLGTNFLALLAYYAASPLYLVTVLIPQEYLMEAMTVLIAVKTGIAGCFMAIYLQGVFRRRNWGTTAFAVLYSLCAYVMGYYWCIMWLDVVAMLPLCILGLNRLIDRGEFKLYTISLAVMMMVNFYIGGMMCIFIFFYYPVLYFSGNRRHGIKGCSLITAKAAFFSLLGIAISAVLFLPVFLALQNTYYIDSSMPEISSMYHSIMDLLTNLLPGNEPTVREGLPNLYCGMITIMLLVYFVMCEGISLKKRLLHCGMLAFLLLSLNWNKLDFLWHGLHFPNQLPFRYSFVFSFLMITVAYEAFLHLGKITPRMIGAVTAGMAGYIILVEKLYRDTVDTEFAWVALLLLFVYGGILAVYRWGKIPFFLTGILILIMVVAEMVGNVVTGVQTVSYTERNTYMESRQELIAMTEEIREKDPGFYRMELLERNTLNDPMLYHYPGISQFSSLVNGRVSYLLDQLGLEGEDAKNRYNYVATTPLINALFNVKYLMGKGDSIDGEEDFFQLKGGEELSTFYENRYPLSAGYMVNQTISDWDYEAESPFAVQNDFINKATGVGGKLFTSIGEPVSISGKNLSLGEYEHGAISCTAVDTLQEADVTLEFEAQETQNIYLKVRADGAEWVTAQNQNGRVVSIQEDCDAIVHAGKYEAGEKVKIEIHYSAGSAQDIEAYAYSLNQQVWEEAWQRLAREQLKVKDYDERMIQGTVDVQEDGNFVMSVPYDRGWTVEVDGKEVEIQPLADALLMFPLEEGTHTVRIYYLPEGLIAGCIITVLGILVLAILSFLRSRKYRVLYFFRKKKIRAGLK